MFRLVSSLLPERAVQNLTAIYFTAQHWCTVGSGKFHSSQQAISYPNMKIQVLPALSDNYMYLLTDEQSGECAVVDPVTPATVLEAVGEGINLTTVLTTHHHWDHAGGNAGLLEQAGRELRVYGGDDRIPGLTNMVKHGDTVRLGSLQITCLCTPCHTTGHVCYYVTSSDPDSNHPPAVFTGDTLFLSGCGKFFEGTAEQMHHALVDILGALPDNTHVYCGHEYALSNLAFGRHVEPDNAALLSKLAAVKELRENSRPSVPSTIGEEKQYNPFMRVGTAEVQRHTATEGGVETMRALRAEKDNWKPPT